MAPKLAPRMAPRLVPKVAPKVAPKLAPPKKQPKVREGEVILGGAQISESPRGRAPRRDGEEVWEPLRGPFREPVLPLCSGASSLRNPESEANPPTSTDEHACLPSGTTLRAPCARAP